MTSTAWEAWKRSIHTKGKSDQELMNCVGTVIRKEWEEPVKPLDIVHSNMHSIPKRKDLRSSVRGGVSSKDLKALAKD